MLRKSIVWDETGDIAVDDSNNLIEVSNLDLLKNQILMLFNTKGRYKPDVDFLLPLYKITGNESDTERQAIINKVEAELNKLTQDSGDIFKFNYAVTDGVLNCNIYYSSSDYDNYNLAVSYSSAKNPVVFVSNDKDALDVTAVETTQSNEFLARR